MTCVNLTIVLVNFMKATIESIATCLIKDAVSKRQKTNRDIIDKLFIEISKLESTRKLLIENGSIIMPPEKYEEMLKEIQSIDRDIYFYKDIVKQIRRK